LEKLVGEIVRSRTDWAAISPEQLQAVARQVGQALRGELMLSSARNKYLLSRIERTVERVIESQDAVAQRGGFRPRWVELKFGPGQALPPLILSTPGGREVHLRGKIDRVDLLEKQAAFAVIDYKLTERTLALDQVYHGLSLQLLTYLLVLEAGGENL